jgi:hypothetical protein
MVVAATVVGLPTVVHASGDRTCLGFSFQTVIVGMRASYRRMAAGAHYPKVYGCPQSGSERRGRSRLGPSTEPDS